MTLDAKLKLKLQFLMRVVRKESEHLAFTDGRLFASEFTLAQVKSFEVDPNLAERVEAFVGRFCRLQDTVGDKLLPQLLFAMGERTASHIDNLDCAERLGLIESAEGWMTMRNLRNQMVHEYVEDPAILLNALQTGHLFVPILRTATNNMLLEIERRGWI
ncbi:MAG: hypothetical protein ABL855_00245 [Sideroxydans sp.]